MDTTHCTSKHTTNKAQYNANTEVETFV